MNIDYEWTKTPQMKHERWHKMGYDQTPSSDNNMKLHWPDEMGPGKPWTRH